MKDAITRHKILINIFSNLIFLWLFIKDVDGKRKKAECCNESEARI